eukprot:2950006-Amphidinium_carterae.1
MTAKEVATSVHVATKMTVESQFFWQRAGVALGDLAAAMNRKQLTLSCHALGIARWNEDCQGRIP